MTRRPHDALFKAGFEHPAPIAGLYRGFYPPSVYNRVDWSSIRPESGAFIGFQLDDKHTDLLFSARLHSSREGPSAKRIYLYLLLEHQSTNDDYMPLRMYNYLGHIYNRHRKLHERPLAHVLPLIVTHARDGWTAPRSFGELFEPASAEVEGLTEFTPQFSVKVLDLSPLTNEQIDERATTAAAKVVLWLLRDSRNGIRLLSNLRYWTSTIAEALRSPNGDAFIAQVHYYVFQVTEDLHYEEFRATLCEQIPEAERLTMTIAEELMQRGREKGRQEGRQEGRLEGRSRLLEQLLTLKFGPLQDEHRQRLETATEEQLVAYAERILTADSIEAVFA